METLKSKIDKYIEDHPKVGRKIIETFLNEQSNQAHPAYWRYIAFDGKKSYIYFFEDFDNFINIYG